MNIPLEMVLHERFFNPQYDWQGSHLYGQSPLKAALKNLTRNNYTKISTTAKMESGGMEGVLFVNDQRGYDEFIRFITDIGFSQSLTR